MVITQTMKLLKDISSGYESSKMLLDLDSVNYVLQHHTVILSINHIIILNITFVVSIQRVMRDGAKWCISTISSVFVSMKHIT